MAKVSIGLRGWRFDEADVLTDDGDLRPLEEMPDDARERVNRLTTLVTAPCDCCWLLHGDEDADEANVATAVYGEPDGEVLLCDDHEDEFVWWYREEGGDEYRGQTELQDRFHEWFEAGNRAPDWFDGIRHVETDPEDLPDPEVVDRSDEDTDVEEEKREHIDLRNMEVRRGSEVEESPAVPVETDDHDHGQESSGMLDVQPDVSADDSG